MPRWPAPPLPARFLRTGQPFVGRRSELEQLELVWGHVEQGAGQAVVVAGAAGTGKSHLVAEVARAVHAHEAVVLLGACSPDPDVPYHPFVEALDQLFVGTEPGRLAGLIPRAARPLERITPHLDRHGPHARDPAVPSEGENRWELFEAYASLLESVAAERPVAIVVEDLQWAPAPTRLLLAHLLRSAAHMRLLLLVTMRDTAPDRSEELTAFVTEAYRSPHVHRIDLRGLGTDDIATYLRAVGGVADRDVAEAALLLQEQTAGNAFFLRELWRDLAHRGGFTALQAGAFAAPQTVSDTLETRISRFSAGERECLELAAVLGATFEVADIAAASGSRREQVLEALDQASQHGLIRYDPTTGSFAFQHALVRQAIQEGLSASRSARLHARLAEAIEPSAASRPALAGLLARLYGGAKALGCDDQRLRYLTEAARHAQRGLAHEEAAQLWEQAARVRPGDRARTDELLLAAADSHLLAGDFTQARRLYREVTTSPDDRAALRAAIGFGDASWRPGRGGREPLELVTAALDRVDADPTDPTYVRALASRARALAFCGELQDATRLSATALELARHLGDERLVADALVASLLQVMTTPGSIAVHHQRAIELRNLAIANRSYDQLGPAGSYRALTSYMGGNLDGWAAGREDVALAASRTGQPFWAWVVGCFEHCEQLMAGDFAGAEATAERIRRLGSTFGADDTEGPYGLQMFLVRRETGRLEQVRGLLTGEPARDGTWLPGLLALYTELGMQDASRRLLARLLDGLDDADRATAIWPGVVAFLAQAAIRLGDEAALQAVEPLVGEYDGFNLVVGQCVSVLGSADLLLAQIRALRGDADAAEGHFETALATDLRVRSAVHQAETLARYSLFLHERNLPGDRERAAAHRRTALALAEPRGHRRVLDLLADQGPPGLPDGLTPREVDVLRLLAQGASNKEIGARLFISKNTAANHVRSILNKTGAANRTQAAIYAADRDLVTTAPQAGPSHPASPAPRSR